MWLSWQIKKIMPSKFLIDPICKEHGVWFIAPCKGTSEREELIKARLYLLIIYKTRGDLINFWRSKMRQCQWHQRIWDHQIGNFKCYCSVVVKIKKQMVGPFQAIISNFLEQCRFFMLIFTTQTRNFHMIYINSN
jgi:hypothetical protein